MPGLLLLLAPHSADALPRAAFRDSYNTLRITTFGTSLPSPPSGGVFLSDPAAAQNLAGDTIVTARDSWGSLYVNVFSNSSQTWGQWSGPYGSVQGNPGIAVVPDGTVYIAARDNFYSYWLFRYRPGMGMLESVHLGGVFASDPSIAASPDGSVYLVGRDTYTSVWAYHFAPGFPSDWVFLGAIVRGKPVITAGSDQAAYVIVRENPNASSGNVWTGRLDDIHWSGWFLANAIAGDAELALAATAGAAIFAAIADPWGSIYQFNLTTPDTVPLGCCYDFYVISLGATGLGFQQIPGRPPVGDRNYERATVVLGESVRLKVTANNIPLIPGDSAYISAISQMPRIAARLEDANGQPISGSVQWNLTVTWFQKKRGNPYKEEFSATLAAGQEWVPVQSDSTDFFGGEAKINWTYNGYSPSTPFAFRIAGTNPSQSDALAELVSKEQTSGIWFLRNVAIHETTLQQFCPTGWKECKPRDPFWTNSAGYGMMQLDPPPTLASVWNWRTNIAEAVTVLQNKAGPPVDTLDNEDKRAFPFYLRQVRQWRQWNQIPNTPQVPAPLDYPADSNYTIGGRRVRDFCQFTLSEVPLDGPVIRWYGDATLMKQYAGTLGPTGNANFLVWDNETNPLFPEWKFHPATTKDADIASEFCTCRTVATCVR